MSWNKNKPHGYAAKKQTVKTVSIPVPGNEKEDPFNKDWKRRCCVCGALPTVGTTTLCGPCCFGESETVGGNW